MTFGWGVVIGVLATLSVEGVALMVAAVTVQVRSKNKQPQQPPLNF